MGSVKAICMPRLLNGFPCVGEAGAPVRRSSNTVAGKMKKPPMTMVEIAARGVLQVARVAEASQIADEVS